MSFCLYELAMNEDVQNILRREILQVLEKHGNNLTYDSMAEMKYLQMVIEGQSNYCIIYLIYKLFVY